MLVHLTNSAGWRSSRFAAPVDAQSASGAERVGEAPVLAGGEPCRYTLRSFINSNREGQRYSWMNASSDWRHGGIMFEQSVQSNDLEIRVFLKVEGVASAAFRDPRIRDTTSGKHAKETGRPRSPNKGQGYTGVEPARDRDFGARSDLLPAIPVRHSTHLQNLGRPVN